MSALMQASVYLGCSIAIYLAVIAGWRLGSRYWSSR
jgi:hypothetical protein